MFDYLSQLARHGRIDPVEYYVSDVHRAVYVENAKVACTSIKAAMYPDMRRRHPGQAAFHAALRPVARRSLPAAARDYLVFTFVRHPADRLRSCHRDKVERLAEDDGASILQRRFHRSIFAAFAGMDPARGPIPFDSFARAVSRIPDRLSDRHFAAQAQVVDAVRSAPRHFIGRFETLARDWAAVRRETGLPELSSENPSQAAGEGLAPSVRRIIARRYARDFALLDYAP